MNNEILIVSLVIIIICLITLFYVYFLFYKIKKIKVQNKHALDISKSIKEGASAFLKCEFQIIIPFIVIFALVLLVLGFVPQLKDKAEGVGWQSAICFIIGALFSGLAGFIGMTAATKANVRTTNEASIKGMSGALKVAFSGGSILGLSVVSLGLLGLTLLFLIFTYTFGIYKAVSVVTGYGLGCSMIALFGRVGGGIYTKAADVGADLVGKVESGIPEDDPRNPAVIADNVGDNVGDIAGMGSDLTESYVGSIVSCLTMGSIMISSLNDNNPDMERYIVFPLIISLVGIVGSILAVIFIRFRKWNNPHKALNIATYVATIIVSIVSLFLAIFYMNNWKLFLSIFAGLLTGVLIGFIAELYTSSDYKEVKLIAKESQTGHATNIIAGMGSGMRSTALTILVLVLGIALAFIFGDKYGIALAAVSMLSTAGITVSVDAYGPIADNAGGIAEMSNMDESVREVTDTLDSVGNTTAAIGKGFCIGSATFTALALIVSYTQVTLMDELHLEDPKFIVGVLIGAMLPYLFSALTITSVGKAANKMIDEVRKQFKDDPGIMLGTSKPNYARCVDISTKAALKEMILPGVIAVLSPIIIGFVFGVEGLGGALIGGLVSAIMLAVFMANAGGARDNAKKYIEKGNFGGKGSDTHKAAVTGDTVGDPLKDTAGPSMDILIKLMSIISLIIGPILTIVPSLWDYIVGLI